MIANPTRATVRIPHLDEVERFYFSVYNMENSQLIAEWTVDKPQAQEDESFIVDVRPLMDQVRGLQKSDEFRLWVASENANGRSRSIEANQTFRAGPPMTPMALEIQ